MYSLDTDIRSGRITLSFDGHMEQDPEAFFQDFSRAALAIKRVRRDWTLLVDFTKTPVMEQYRAKNTAKIFDWCLSQGVHRVACVTAMITQRMQLQRVTGKNAIIAYFENRTQALRWLGEEGLGEERSGEDRLSA